jgi:hypothetical protein
MLTRWRVPCLTAALILLLPFCLRADIAATIGGGNFDSGRRLDSAPARFKALNTIGGGICRIPISVNDYYNPRDNAPHPQRLDELVLMAHRHGITPMVLFEYYTRWNGPLGGRDKWLAVGRAYAGRFRPNSPFLLANGIRDWGIIHYTAINEPMWKDNNPTRIDPAEYAIAIEALADGVHSVDPALKVSPGGYQEVPLFQNRNPFIKAVAPLYNSGKLHAIDIHRYWDVQYVPMTSYRFSLQAQFEQVKQNAGITADVAFHTTEMNFKKRLVTEEQAAAGLLTALWDALGVTGQNGQPVTQFVMPWNLFHLAERDEHYGMCTRLDPWTPTARGKVVQSVCRLAAGMKFTRCEPKRGEFVLEGAGRKLWVWQNRGGWTSAPGQAFAISGIPAGAKVIEVHGWDGLLRMVDVGERDSLLVDGLRPEETWMFLAR